MRAGDAVQLGGSMACDSLLEREIYRRAHFSRRLKQGWSGAVLSQGSHHDESFRGKDGVRYAAGTIPIAIMCPILQTGHSVRIGSAAFSPLGSRAGVCRT